MQIERNNYLLHVYYGSRVTGDITHLVAYKDWGFSGNPQEAMGDRTFSLDTLPQEYPCYGTGDYRTPAFSIKDKEGVYGCNLKYQSHTIHQGKYQIPRLPAVYTDACQGETLEVALADPVAGVQVTLLYGVIPDRDVITRAAIIKNIGDEKIILTKAHSGNLDCVQGEYDILHFHGRHGMERILERTPVIMGKQSFGSLRGISSHQENPFIILADRDTTEDYGGCIGMALLYSGNFECEIERDQTLQTRVTMGVKSQMFEYDLEPGDTFHAPEIAYIYSSEGLTQLSHRYHKLIREHICRGPYRDIPRPILLNNWEATYFDFNGEKILEIAQKAAKLGVEMLVLDDGWFGKRDSDNTGLGDWFVNEKKLGMPLANLVSQVNALGLKFGLWFEPEMISEDSELYRQHSDWAFAIPGKKPLKSRNQFVLDFSRTEVVDYILHRVTEVIQSANIEYVKLDMNRAVADVYTAGQGCQNHGAILYHYVCGVYDFLERLQKHFPNLLMEGCSGGGGRFDAGMLHYTPQIWCSDNTDAIERLKIQYGTSFAYPILANGSHVSAVPNHQTGRTTSFATRAVVAMAGTFGYELDLNQISVQEQEEVGSQIREAKKYWKLIHQGLYFRLTNACEDREFTAWEFVSEDGKEVLINVVTLAAHCNAPVYYIKLKGLHPEKNYRVEGEERIYSGGALMYGGLPIPQMDGEYQVWQRHMTEV
jgi:alpha-galactosidase